MSAHPWFPTTEEIPTTVTMEPSSNELDATKNGPKLSKFSIDCLLAKKVDDDFEDANITDDEDYGVQVIKPTPIMASEASSGPSMQKVIADNLIIKEDGGRSSSDDEAAIAAVVQSSLYFSQQPTNLLYSQWLASRNTSALFGLQGNYVALIN